MRIVTEGKDYLTNKDVFLDVQDGADLRELETYDHGKRLITNMRDLSTWVHYDALYQAYLTRASSCWRTDIRSILVSRSKSLTTLTSSRDSRLSAARTS